VRRNENISDGWGGLHRLASGGCVSGEEKIGISRREKYIRSLAKVG